MSRYSSRFLTPYRSLTDETLKVNENLKNIFSHIGEDAPGASWRSSAEASRHRSVLWETLFSTAANAGGRYNSPWGMDTLETGRSLTLKIGNYVPNLHVLDYKTDHATETMTETLIENLLANILYALFGNI